MSVRTLSLIFSLAVGVTAWPSRAACAAAVSASELDNAEARICMAQSSLKRAVIAAEEAPHQSVPVEQIANQHIDNPAARAYVQEALDRTLIEAQNQIVASDRRDLDRYQADYRRLTGKIFDTAACDGAQVWVTHAWQEQQKRQAAMNASLMQSDQRQNAGMQQVLADARVSDACGAKKYLDLIANAPA